MTPRVSVVVPTFRRPRLVVRAVASALAQSVRAIEVVVDTRNLTGHVNLVGDGERSFDAVEGARILAARRAIEALERGRSPSQAARGTVDFLKERIVEGEGGLILLDCQGRFGVDFNSSTMTYGWWSERDGEGVVV